MRSSSTTPPPDRVRRQEKRRVAHRRVQEISPTDRRPGGDSRSKVAVEIQVESLYTDNDKLTGHLKSPDFFDGSASKPTASSCHDIRSVGGDEGWSHLMTGRVTLHGRHQDGGVIPVRVRQPRRDFR